MSSEVSIIWVDGYQEDAGHHEFSVERRGKQFKIKATHEGVIIDVYNVADGEFVGSPFSATYAEMEFEADVHAVLNHVESEETNVKKDT